MKEDNQEATIGPGTPADVVRATELVYAELKRLARQQMARERKGHTLQPTALVNEAFERLADNMALTWQNQAHFVALAAGIMRQVLVDHARKKNADKRGGDQQQVTLVEELLPMDESTFDLLDLHEAIDKLAELHPEMAKLVELRFFGGLNLEDLMSVLEQPRRTIDRNWKFARLWLARELGHEPTAQ
jgi:RNA polymerase sigma factor (TIGR02999 family)